MATAEKINRKSKCDPKKVFKNAADFDKKYFPKQYEACCNDCGSRRYPQKRDMGMITICGGICPFCKKFKPIVPGSDWAFGAGDTNEWD